MGSKQPSITRRRRRTRHRRTRRLRTTHAPPARSFYWWASAPPEEEKKKFLFQYYRKHVYIRHQNLHFVLLLLSVQYYNNLCSSSWRKKKWFLLKPHVDPRYQKTHFVRIFLLLSSDCTWEKNKVNRIVIEVKSWRYDPFFFRKKRLSCFTFFFLLFCGSRSWSSCIFVSMVCVYAHNQHVWFTTCIVSHADTSSLLLQGFVTVIVFLLLTELILSIVLLSAPSPLTVLIFLPVVAFVFTAGVVGYMALTIWYEFSWCMWI